MEDIQMKLLLKVKQLRKLEKLFIKNVRKEIGTHVIVGVRNYSTKLIFEVEIKIKGETI